MNISFSQILVKGRELKTGAETAIRRYYENINETLDKGGRERNRLLLLFFSGLFFLNYLLYCLHVEKYPFDIFPPLPVFEKTRQVTLHLPSPDGKTIFQETRTIPAFESERKLVSFLFHAVRKGSVYENTIIAVPVELHIKDIWFYSESGVRGCYISVDPVVLQDGVQVVRGSEALFRTAVEKTITANLPSVKKVMILERGVPGKPIWDL